MQRSIFEQLFQKACRYYSYKSVKRPDFTAISKVVSHPVGKEVRPKENVDLTKQLQAKILATGPITIAEYMQEVLINPQSGYYMNRDVFGREGDFITSPEISQIFGELVAIWVLSEWQKIGGPPFQLVELGPGRGTLARDVLKVLSQFKLGSNFSMHLVEISPHLSTLQAQLLCYKHEAADSNTEGYYQKGVTASGIQVYWYSRLEDVPAGFSIVLAHEFFDALPVHKLQMEDGLWKEVLVDIADKQTDETDFRFVLSKNQTPISKIFEPIAGETRQCLEYSIESDRLISLLAGRFEANGGIGLIIDYGHFGEKSDTLRAFKRHELFNPLKSPGTADITVDVDFRQMKRVAERDNKVLCLGPVEQGLFLQRMEGEVRLERLLKNALPENQTTIKSAYEMLTQPEKMGSRFKFFSMFPAVLKDHLQKFPVNGFQ
ncbi:protein arginine methyltransferase NDUFAF7 homolog, mitochondrial [Calliphora vicina]|uniref:protein arginine methyltransferase NDUFAF7 homolog, mitochondrial n=1 Tax=Calliphora vicina TaxID=7373 RepID=UPI00325A8D5E